GMATYLVPVAKDGVKSVPEAKEETEAKTSEKIVGLKEGHINIKLARLDTRLLHGQVATAWTPDSKANRIIVVSDAVAKDELRKSLIQQAAPNNVRANIVPISKMIEVAKDDRFGGVDAFLLFETVEDVLTAVEGGVPIKSLNVGSMAHSEGKTMVNKVLSMDKNDVATFEKLRDLGVEFDVRKVPNDSKANLFDLIKKANVK
ncbi:MAG: PTS system mannose/fructose/N-acetylgalactosamine-transporter subunit IIB, partial [Leuconostoc mesenteroides]